MPWLSEDCKLHTSESLVDEVEGLGIHTDMSCVTIVYQDEVGGLQVESKEGKLMDTSPCEQTLVVNMYIYRRYAASLEQRQIKIIRTPNHF